MDGKLRQARKERGWTLAQAAEELCLLCEKISGKSTLTVDYTVMGRWERGSITPSPYYQEKLCLLYQATPEQLGFEEDGVKRRTAIKLAGAGMMAAMMGVYGNQYEAYEETLSLAWNTYYTGQIVSTVPLLTTWRTYLHDRSKEVAGREKQDMQSLLCRFYQLSGVIAREQGQLDQAISFANDSVLLARHLKNSDLLTTASIREASSLAESKKIDMAVFVMEQATTAAKKAQHVGKGYFMMYLSQLYSQQGTQKRKALALLDDVESSLRAKGTLAHDGSFMQVDTNGFFMLRGEVLRRYGEYAEAEKSLDLVGGQLGVRWQGNLLVAKAELARAKDDHETAKGLAQQAATIAAMTGSQTMSKKAHTILEAVIV